MHIDARKIENNSIIKGDICIVGAGASGISIAMEWINSPYKVILLEGGGFEYDDKVQELYNGKVTGQNYFPLKSTRLHQFGGTTGLWAGACSTLDEIDFMKRDWVQYSGWPISKEDLNPYYERAHVNLDLGKFEYDLDYWRRINPLFKPLPLNDESIWNKIWHFSPPSRFGEKYESIIEKANNIYLYTYANAVNIIGNENINNITQIKVKNYAGKTHLVEAKYFILACGAIQNSRLLLASNKQARNGLGNQNDLVGRFFMEHLEIRSAELWLSKEHPMNLYIDKSITNTRAELAIKDKLQIRSKILNGSVSFAPLINARMSKPKSEKWIEENPVLNMNRKSLSIWERLKMKVKKMNIENEIPGIDKAFQLYIRLEQAPNPSSRVFLDKETDSLGVPLANLNWEFTSLEKKSIRKIFEIIGQEIGFSEIGRIRLDEYLRDKNNNSTLDFTGGFHHMGTTRMSLNPKEGVVDSNCKIHGIKNLFVAGSSCFSTSGAPNPTLTLVALSLRLSDHIKSKFPKY